MREDWVWGQASSHQQPAEVEEEGEEEEKVRLSVFYLNFQSICKQTVCV